MALFMEECLEAAPAAMERTSQVYSVYQGWCNENGFHAENVRNFRSLLAGYATVERRRPYLGGEKTTVLVGYRIRDETSKLFA